MNDWAELARVDIGLRTGTSVVGDAVRWADAEILRASSLSDELVAISLGDAWPRDEMLHQVALLMRRAPQDVVRTARAEWATRALARLAAAPAHGPVIANEIRRLADTPYFPSEEFSEVFWIDDVFDELGTGVRVFGWQLSRNPALECLSDFLVRVGGRRESK